jgi:hypothetical protein
VEELDLQRENELAKLSQMVRKSKQKVFAPYRTSAKLQTKQQILMDIRGHNSKKLANQGTPTLLKYSYDRPPSELLEI